MTLFELSPQDRLNFKGQIHTFYEEAVSADGNKHRVYKRYHDNRRVTFSEDLEVELYDQDMGGKLFYKLKDIQ